jgi:hypothetical protein
MKTVREHVERMEQALEISNQAGVPPRPAPAYPAAKNTSHAVESPGVEKVTRKFYERFKEERASLVTGIEGIPSLLQREHYASLILYRLMFLYFMQKKGFLDGNLTYLADHLSNIRARYGSDRYYRSFLLCLFREGLGTPERSPEISTLLGNVPYLDGDLFVEHEIERTNSALQISDAHFSRLFAFFNAYHWHLDERPIVYENEISPAILGYIFEKYINQYQVGAYYTREDVTGYIAKNTIIPYLFEQLARILPSTFGPGGRAWQLLCSAPERYIHPSMCETAPLPGETPYEHRARIAHFTTISRKLSSGSIQTIDDCITCNLDLCRFALDALTQLDTVESLQVVYEQLQQISILDPTCGSGAFLFAALRILEPLYTICLERIEQLRGTAEGEQRSQAQQRYNILKSIITRNLYGVDIMEEAVEICKLCLFLRLVAQIERVEEIEPLPQLDHHIRTGNALVGLVTLPPDLTNETVSRASLDIEIGKHYALTADDNKAFERWRTTHKPFHWCSEFRAQLQSGGFNVIIGNPPYVEYNQRFPYQLRGYTTLSCGNLYPCIIERSQQLLSSGGRYGMILPLAAFATRTMIPLIEGLYRWFPVSWISFYHFRPSMLFSGGKVASIPTAIYLAKPGGRQQRYSTAVLKWSAEHRSLLFPTLTYCQVTIPPDPENRHYYPKFGTPLENTIMEKVLSQQAVRPYLSPTPDQNTIYYRSAGGLYWKVFINFPWPYATTSNKQCSFQEHYDRDIFVALFNSSLFWWYYTVTFDTFNLKDYMLFGFHFTYPSDTSLLNQLKALCQHLMENFQQHARHLTRGQTGSYTIYARKAKPILDEIDRCLAQHYGFTEEEVEFILKYDLKYRMGSKTGESK